MAKITIKEWAKDDRPREKMLLKGIQALSNAELLAILLGSGNKNQTAVELAQHILNTTGNSLLKLGKLSINDLKKFKGVGTAKAVTIAAALELGKRRKQEAPLKKNVIRSSTDAYEVIHPLLSDLPHEEFIAVYLNRRNEIISIKNISKGGVSGTLIDTRLILKNAIDLLASGIIIAHNHPSGNEQPSDNDKRITQKIKQASSLIDIQLLDHLVIGEKSYFSFADNAIL